MEFCSCFLSEAWPENQKFRANAATIHTGQESGEISLAEADTSHGFAANNYVVMGCYRDGRHLSTLGALAFLANGRSYGQVWVVSGQSPQGE